MNLKFEHWAMSYIIYNIGTKLLFGKAFSLYIMISGDLASWLVIIIKDSLINNRRPMSVNSHNYAGSMYVVLG